MASPSTAGKVRVLFQAIPVGGKFIDPISQSEFVKVSETEAAMIENGKQHTRADEFEDDEPVYQVD